MIAAPSWYFSQSTLNVTPCPPSVNSFLILPNLTPSNLYLELTMCGQVNCTYDPMLKVCYLNELYAIHILLEYKVLEGNI